MMFELWSVEKMSTADSEVIGTNKGSQPFVASPLPKLFCKI